MNLLVTLTGTLLVFILMKAGMLKYSGRALLIVALSINMAFRLFILIPMAYFSPAGPLLVLRNTVQVVPRVAGQVTAVHVKSQDKVEPGTPLFSIDPRDYAAQVKRLEASLADAETRASVLEEQVQSAEANLETARQQLVVAEAQFSSASIEQLRSATAATSGALATFMLAERERQRNEQLFKSRVASAEEFDKSRQAEATARNALRAAEAQEAAAGVFVSAGENQINSAREQVALAESALRQAKINSAAQSDGANPLVAQARAQLTEARLRLDWTTVTAPIAGTVLNVQLRPGQIVGSAPVLVLQDDSDTKFQVAIKQTNLRHVKVGDPGEIFLDLYPGSHFPAKVVQIGEGVTEGQLTATGALADTSIAGQRSPIAVRLEPDDSKLTDLLPTGAGGTGAIFTDKFTISRVPRKVISRVFSWMDFLMP